MPDSLATHVLDANIVLSWFLDRPYSDHAIAYRQSDRRNLAPDLLVHEMGSALSYYVKSQVIDLERAEQCLDDALLFVELVPGTTLNVTALRIAVDTNHPIYDCFYLALSKLRKLPLVTADAKLADIARRTNIDVVLLS